MMCLMTHYSNPKKNPQDLRNFCVFIHALKCDVGLFFRDLKPRLFSSIYWSLNECLFETHFFVVAGGFANIEAVHFYRIPQRYFDINTFFTPCTVNSVYKIKSNVGFGIFYCVDA